jgi:hypothetical protein
MSSEITFADKIKSALFGKGYLGAAWRVTRNSSHWFLQNDKYMVSTPIVYTETAEEVAERLDTLMDQKLSESL